MLNILIYNKFSNSSHPYFEIKVYSFFKSLYNLISSRYGLLDASRMVEIAKNWTNVGPDLHCQSEKQTYDMFDL